LVLAARGLSNHRIATERNLSEATVKRHLANVYQKIGVRSRSEAVRTALVEQWIGIHDMTLADSDGSSALSWTAPRTSPRATDPASIHPTCRLG
jgi:hypothetical protein